ncbi:DUF362 domain-containing protein [Methanocaldococcus infernus]
MNKVYFDYVDSYDKLNNKILDLIFKDIDDKELIVVKPNILRPSKPESGVVTHYKFVDWVLKYLKKEFSGKIVVGESSGFSTNKAFEVSKIKDVCLKNDVEFLNFEKDEHELYNIEGYKIALPKTVLESDLIVNLPKLKTHVLMKYTGGVKNLYGCVPGGLKPKLHGAFPKEEGFAKLLMELYKIIAKDREIISIMDGIVGMEGNGPSNGRVKKANIVIASDNPVALDKFASYYIGYKPEEILTNNLIDIKYKLYHLDKEIDLKDVRRVKFKKPDTIFLNKVLPSFIVRLIFKFFTLKPEIDKRRCVKCGICEKICPVEAIKDLKVDKKKCISCYCCHELCKYNAIKLKRGIF